MWSPSQSRTENPDSGPARHTDGKTKLLKSRLDLLFARHRGEVFPALILLASLYPVLHTTVPPVFLLSWIAAAAILIVARHVLLVRYWRADERGRELGPWYQWYGYLTVVAGGVWGAGALLVSHYGDFIHQICSMLVVWALVVAALSVMASDIRMVGAFAAPLLAPVVWLFLQQGTAMGYVMAGANVAFAVVAFVTALHLGGALARSFKVGLENTELIQRLAHARQQSERARLELERTNEALAREAQERERAKERIRDSERKLSSILHNMQDVVYRTDRNNVVTWVTSSVKPLLGFAPEEFTGMRFAHVYERPEDEQRLGHELETHYGLAEHFEAELRTKSGGTVWTSINAQYYHDNDGAIAGIEGCIRDITVLRYAQDALRQEQERAQVTLESIGDGVITTDVAGVVEYLNTVAEDMTGWSLRDARGLPLDTVLQLVDEVTRYPVTDPVKRCLQKNGTVGVPGHTALLHRYENREHCIEITAAPIRDTAGQVIGAVVALHDVTKLRGLARQMTHQATHDALTGLVNRREFENRVDNAIATARTDDKQHAVCYLDLDQFKVVNDTCGHAAGDELLKQLAHLLQRKVRESDTLARLGGDEFGVLLQGCRPEQADAVAEDLRKTVEDFRFVWDTKSFRVGASVGVVSIDAGSGTLSDVLSAADSACYIAKDRGRNRVHVYQPDDLALSQRHGEMQWMQRIQWALDEQRFRLFFQPILPISKQSIQGEHCELLVRMVSEHGELVSPYAFLPAAERYHLMPKVDRWVVAAALRMLGEHTRRLKDMRTCSINLSGQSLSEDTFLKFVVDQIETSGVDPRRLCFEITETAVIANLSSATHFISALKEMGCRFALDDFGSGLSSFSYLKNLPVDYLKLDGSFVKNLVRDQADRAMVKAINEVAHVMGIQTTAEFVEDNNTLKALQMFKIDYAQGYHIGRPQPVEEESNIVRLPINSKAG